jgi:hypothetical protein
VYFYHIRANLVIRNSTDLLTSMKENMVAETTATGAKPVQAG